ncbi:PREDICTED: uncharacterized protein LOC101292333 [Fragaria vesca subsp. vesca]|uniref:uncharacterized protein LOC101292333 n=1 Tax=Fragaria vesca subsp. vesca TaxID=101020 RepID=UPI0002C3024E|nr:PREDICTED: uncharacterized protein LOC101292333 [Fragaria vesca subsp. vesca]
MDHSFCHCPSSLAVWNLAHCNDLSNANDMVETLNDIFINRPYDADKLSKIILLCWQIWQKRKNVIFRNEIFSPHAVVAGAAAFTRRLNSQTNTSSCVAAHSNNIKWSLPSSGYVKLNFDGYVFQHNSNFASGFVLRDDSGCPLIAYTRRIGKTDVPIAEVVALRDGLLSARNRNISRVIAEGDSQLVINCIKSTTSIPSKLSSIVKDIIHIATRFEHISFSHTFQEANFIANVVANHSHVLGFKFFSAGCYCFKFRLL